VQVAILADVKTKEAWCSKLNSLRVAGSEILCSLHMRTCPTHDTPMVPHLFEPLEAVLPEGVELFRCPNLSCCIFYASGTLQGFYIRTKNGELMPYEKKFDQK
jgi:hypothetical protein